MDLQMALNLLCWFLQLVTLKDIHMATLIVHLLESCWDEKIKLYWVLQMGLLIVLNLVLMK